MEKLKTDYKILKQNISGWKIIEAKIE